MGVRPEVRWEIQWHPAGGGVVRRIMLTRRGVRLAMLGVALAALPMVALLALLPLGLQAVLGRVTAGATRRQNLALHHEHEKLRQEAEELAERVQVLLGRGRRLAWVFGTQLSARATDEAEPPRVTAADGELLGWLTEGTVRLGELGDRLAMTPHDGACTVQSLPTGSPIDPSRAVPVAAYGWRVSPFTNKEEPHYGVTLAAATGEPVLAPGAARVAYAGIPRERHVNEWTRFGSIVVLDHGCGVFSVFGHLQRITVRAGRKVARGDQVGTVGATGWTRVPALYYEIRWPLTRDSRPIDPALVDVALPLGDLAERLRDPTAGLPEGFANLRHLRGFR